MMITSGLALDTVTGEILQYRGSGGVHKIGQLISNGNGGGDMTLDFGEPRTFDAGEVIPRGFWVFTANPAGGYGGIVMGSGSNYVSVSQYRGTLVFCDGQNDKVNAAADPGPTLQPIQVVPVQ